jgi:hypothetical protein
VLKLFIIRPLLKAANFNKKRFFKLLKYDLPLKLYFKVLKLLIKSF